MRILEGLTSGEAPGAPVVTMPATRAANRAARLVGLLGVPPLLLDSERSRSDAAGASVTSATTLGMGLVLIKSARSSPSAFSPSVSHFSILAAMLSVSCVPEAPRKWPHSSK